MKYYKEWIDGVYGELNTPTGWETFESENYLNVDYTELNQPFTEAEKLQAQRSIQELKANIKLIGLNEDVLNAINGKLDQLSVKVDELNKFDWKSLLIGTLVSLIIGFSVPPDCSGMIWEYLKSSFGNLKLNS